MKKLSDIYKLVQNIAVEKPSKMLGIEYLKTSQSSGVDVLTKIIRSLVGHMFKIGKFLTRKLYLIETAAFILDVTNGKRELPIPVFTDYFRQLDSDILAIRQQQFINNPVSAIVEGYESSFEK